jgi:hypothetical protein|tara:strand:+ start:386 stop:559 length:174 start_codon:yes stop_codon:yes gene_type:complete
MNKNNIEQHKMKHTLHELVKENPFGENEIVPTDSWWSNSEKITHEGYVYVRVKDILK